MKLGLSLGYSGRHLDLPLELVQLADSLGYHAVWTAEAYGSDAMSPLAFLAAKTSQIKLGTAVIQLAARTPANAAMTAATIDALAGGGRFICGVGVSGPQIVEGWYGQPWGRPYYRVKDYVAIMRKIWAREAPVTHEGREISLPYEGDGARGLAKPLRSILHMSPIPVWLGTGTETMVKLTGEIADGWFPMGFTPGSMAYYRPWLEEGVRRAGGGKRVEDIHIEGRAAVIITKDVRAALDTIKAGRALYVGGMGHRTMNFHKQTMAQRGYGAEADRVQELFLAGHKEEAAAAIPDEFIDEESLIGTPDRIRERYRPWADCGIDGLTIRTTDPAAIELMASLSNRG
ncbi:MAG: LLM class F420-dependent oxidoreductase [Chromatiales bacterium]|jgi:F420-dependent oxidoreductase-like protein|nr:LLM class F420-dependent oxidoreductase [Chromatiales bacterium]